MKPLLFLLLTPFFSYCQEDLIIYKAKSIEFVYWDSITQVSNSFPIGKNVIIKHDTILKSYRIEYTTIEDITETLILGFAYNHWKFQKDAINKKGVYINDYDVMQNSETGETFYVTVGFLSCLELIYKTPPENFKKYKAKLKISKCL